MSNGEVDYAPAFIGILARLGPGLANGDLHLLLAGLDALGAPADQCVLKPDQEGDPISGHVADKSGEARRYGRDETGAPYDSPGGGQARALRKAPTAS